MTTTRYVNTASTAGGDGTTNATTGANRAYASMSEAESNLPTTLTDDWVIECSGSTTDSTRAVFDGTTTSSSYTITVTATGSNRTTGVWDTGRYRLELSYSGGILHLRDNYLIFDGLQLHNTISSDNTGHVAVLEYGAPENAIIKNCLISASEQGSGIYISDADVTAKIWNTIVYNPHTAGSSSEGIYSNSSSTVEIYNCTVYNFNDGVENDAGTVTVTNCAVFGNTDDFDGTMTISYCASDDGDGSNSVQPSDWSDVFEDYTNGDFRLKSTDTDLIDAGTTISGFSDDIAGNSRGTTWDIGAFEYIGAGTTPVSSDLITVFDIASIVTSDLINSMNVRNSIASDLIQTCNIRGTIASDLISTLDIREAVSSDLITVFDILGVGNTPVSSSLISSMNIRGIVSSDIVSVVDIRNSVSSDIINVFNVRSAVNSSLVSTVDIRDIINSELISVFSMGGAVSSDLVCVFDIGGGRQSLLLTNKFMLDTWG